MKNKSESSSKSGGTGFLGLLQIAFIVLKITGFINWSWWWVLAPICPKPSHARSGPTQKQLGSITPKVRKEVRERSNGLCEVQKKCKGAPAVQQAHKQSRNTIKHKTTANDLLDSCVACHQWLDGNGEGVKHKKALRG